MANLEKFVVALNKDEAVKKTFAELAAKGGEKVDILLATAKACGFDDVTREDFKEDDAKEKMSAKDLDAVAGGGYSGGPITCSVCGNTFYSMFVFSMHSFAHV